MRNLENLVQKAGITTLPFMREEGREEGREGGGREGKKVGGEREGETDFYSHKSPKVLAFYYILSLKSN